MPSAISSAPQHHTVILWKLTGRIFPPNYLGLYILQDKVNDLVLFLVFFFFFYTEISAKMNSVGVRRLGFTRVYSHSKVTESLVFRVFLFGFLPHNSFHPLYLSPPELVKKKKKAESRCCYLRWGSFKGRKRCGSTLSWPGALGRRLQGWVPWASGGHWLEKPLPLLFMRRKGGCVASFLVWSLSFLPSSSFYNDSGRKPETKARQAFQPLIQSWGRTRKAGDL